MLTYLFHDSGTQKNKSHKKSYLRYMLYVGWDGWDALRALLQSPWDFQRMHLNSVNALRALKRNLMASVSSKNTLMVTLIAILVVPGLLSGSPVKFKLKISTSDKKSFIIILFNHVQQYLRVSRSKPRSLTWSLTRRSISPGLSSSLLAVQLQESTFPQREQKDNFAFAIKCPL